MLSPRFLALPAIALTVIIALSQAHSGASTSAEAAPSVLRAVSCAMPSAAFEAACAMAGTGGTTILR